MNDNHLGIRLADLLKRNGLTQRELAKRTGISESTISRYVNENRVPTNSAIINLSNVLHTTSDYLLGLEEKENVKEYDFESEYKQIQKLISRNLKQMSQRQKAKLVYALFEIKD